MTDKPAVLRFRMELEFGMLTLEERGIRECLEKNLSEQG